jgi:hypothetical protein
MDALEEVLLTVKSEREILKEKVVELEIDLRVK